MSQHILITDTGMYINHHLPCLEKYKENIDIIHWDVDHDINKVLNLLRIKIPRFFEASQTLCQSLGYKDVIILGDLNLDILDVFDALQKSEFNANIHLILPIPFERTVKGTIQHEILSNLYGVRSLTVYDPYQLAIKGYGSTDPSMIGKVINEQTDLLLRRISELNVRMPYQARNKKYFYDFSKDSFIDTDSLEVLFDYKVAHMLGLMVDPDRGEAILRPVPRPDGKFVCEQLRTIRREFARLNEIEYRFEECKYNGPCGGTCKVCDREVRELRVLAEKNGAVVYPEMNLEESV